MLQLPLHTIAYARSGDKGSSSNIGLIAKNRDSYDFLVENITEEKVFEFFKPLGVEKVERYLLPNLSSINFVLTKALGGGGSLSLRLDAQGKALGQALLEMIIPIPIKLLKEESLGLIQLQRLGDEIAILSLNRPDKRNALNIALLEELCGVLEHLTEEKQIRALILKGEGAVFCAGLDLNEAADPAVTEHSARLLAKLFRLLYKAPFFVVGAIQGGAVAGGAAMVICCDYVVAAPKSYLSFPEVHKGLIPAMVIALLTEQLGIRATKELTLLAEKIDMDKAMFYGLVNRVIEEDLLLETALETAKKALQAAPNAFCQTKHFMQECLFYPFEENMQQALLLQQQSRGSEEAYEGSRAFLEKRKPYWQEAETLC
jgi:methylglutaconyl-CoA hydratase